jgi:hypothetical protein
MQVSKAIEMLSKLNPNEEIAFTGYWVRSDVEKNTGITFTDDEWNAICSKHEDNIEIHIDQIVFMFFEEEL